MNQSRTNVKIFKALYAALILLGLLAAGYYIYDIISPNHFVGDMYGLEVLYRVAVMLFITIPIVIGLLLIVIALMKKQKKPALIGNVLISAAFLVIIFLAVNVYFARQQDELRKSYSLKSTDELINVALKNKDQFALYEIIYRNDTSAIPALSKILLDTTQDDRLRIESANALGQLGGDSARAALVQASTLPTSNTYLAESIKYSIETIDNKKGRTE